MEAIKIQESASTEGYLENLADRGELFAIVDSFFQIPTTPHGRRLETKDTDPVFYELIAWDQVTYQPPHMVQVDRATLKWMLISLSTERWGLFVHARTSLEVLARHMQKFVIARGPDGNPYFLRFQDAAVLSVLMKTWTPSELEIFFGPVEAFGLPDLDSLAIRIVDRPLPLRALPPPEDCLLQLRDSQLQLCCDAIDRDLVKVIYWHLRNHHDRAVQFIVRDHLEERIWFAIGRGRRYGLATISDLAAFSALMFELAPNFDEHPSFRKVLEDPMILPEMKMRRLSQIISDREWTEAQSLYDRSFWPTVMKTSQRLK